MQLHATEMSGYPEDRGGGQRDADDQQGGGGNNAAYDGNATRLTKLSEAAAVVEGTV